MNHTAPDPSSIISLSTAFWNSQVLLTANRIGIFKVLAQDPLDLETICEALETKPRPTRLLLKACVALGLLRETDDGYCPSAAANAYLVPDRPAYLGNAIRYSDNLYATWGQLEQALREDTPQRP